VPASGGEDSFAIAVWRKMGRSKHTYASYLASLVELMQNPERLRDPRVLQDPITLRIVFTGAAIIIGLFVLLLILWSDAKQNPPPQHVEPEDESRNEDYKRLFEKAQNEPEILTGSTERYDWQQSESEVDVFIPLDKQFADAKSKEIKVKFQPRRISIEICDSVHIEGDLYAEIIPSECNWQIDQDAPTRKLWITLVKKIKTKGKLHWSCVLKGDEQIDTDKFSPMVTPIDTHDHEQMKKAIGDLRQRIRDSNSASSK